MKVNVINKSENPLPKYAHPGDAGCDLYAAINGNTCDHLYNAALLYDSLAGKWAINIQPGGRALIPTEIYTSFPEGYEVQIRSRSGLALKNGIAVINCPGCVDACYRSSWGVILINHGTQPFMVRSGDRIAQAIAVKVEPIEWNEVESLEESERNTNGFGSTK